MRNDRSLTQAQIDTIVAWADGGAPKGSDADLPPLPKFAEGWTFGREPDAILEMPVDFSIPPRVNSACRCSTRRCRGARTGSPRRSRFVRAIARWSITPASSSSTFPKAPASSTAAGDARRQSVNRSRRSAAGRADDTALPGANKLLSWVPGRGVDSHRADIGKRIPAGKYINWQIHYNPIGKATTDRTRLGIWFNKAQVTHELLIRQAGDALRPGGLSLYRAEGKSQLPPTGKHARHAARRRISRLRRDWSLTGSRR
jgi:hypothetical protein